MQKLLKNFTTSPSFLNAISIDNFAGEIDPMKYIPINIGIIRNYTIEPFIPFIRARLLLEGYNPTFYLTGVGSYLLDATDPNSQFWNSREFDMVLVLIWPEALSDVFDPMYGGVTNRVDYESRLKDGLTLIESLIDSAINYSKAPIGISNSFRASSSIFGVNFELKNFGSLNIESFNTFLYEKSSINPRLNIIDVERVSAQLGFNSIYSYKTYREKLLPFNKIAFDSVAIEIAKTIQVIKTGPKKCIIVDCDNTLWGGIVGEAGVDGIELSNSENGYKHLVLQKFLKYLKDFGFVLAIVSKNNHADVLEVFKNRTDMLLKEDDFVATKINWDSKAKNIASLANELSLGLSSFIFIDDSDFECGSVSEQLPEVEVLQFNYLDDNPTGRILDGIPFRKISLTKEDFTKSEMYVAKAKFEKSLEQGDKGTEFLASMGIVVEIFCPGAEDIPRIAQLTQKTNQFNLTTRRYTEDDIISFDKSPHFEVYAIRCSDKFIDHGIIGVVILDKKKCMIDTFLLSCRVLSRGVETSILSHLTTQSPILHGEFIETAKNSLVKDLYMNHNFSNIKDGQNNKIWLWSKQDSIEVKCPEWIKLKVN